MIFIVKKISFVFLIFIFALWAISVFAQEYEWSQIIEIPPGKEFIRVGGNVFKIAPQGAKTRKVGSEIFVEGSVAYTARRFMEIEERLIQLETEQGELTREIEELKMQIKK